MVQRMYVVVLRSLSAGMKAAQACHAMTAFTFAHPDSTRRWFEDSNHLVVLHDDDLGKIASDLEKKGVPVSKFHEPDLGGTLTAICADDRARKHLSSLQLAG